MSKEADLQDGDEGGARWNDDVIGSLTAGAKLSLKVEYPAYLERCDADVLAGPREFGKELGGLSSCCVVLSRVAPRHMICTCLSTSMCQCICIPM
jgi:hypothetical protein